MIYTSLSVVDVPTLALVPALVRLLVVEGA